MSEGAPSLSEQERQAFAVGHESISEDEPVIELTDVVADDSVEGSAEPSVNELKQQAEPARRRALKAVREKIKNIDRRKVGNAAILAGTAGAGVATVGLVAAKWAALVAGAKALFGKVFQGGVLWKTAESALGQADAFISEFLHITPAKKKESKSSKK